MKNGLIIEDIPKVAAEMEARLAQAFPNIHTATVGSLAAARKILSTYEPQIALLDLGLPDGEGIALLRDGLLADTMVIVTTIFDDDEHLFDALRAGAQGYLLKDEPDLEFVDALRGAASGRPPLSARMARKMIAFFNLRNREGEARLSTREQEVLSLVARGYSVRKVSEMLGVTPNTTSGYLKNVYQKLQINSRAEAALEALRRGLVSPTTL